MSNSAISLKRFEGNPIISPVEDHPWEAKATFNAAAIYEGGEVHLIYRAMSHDNVSVFGYASSEDGFHINERLPEPIYVPREDFEKKLNPGGNSGCEDPRITKIGNRIYMCYTAYDGKNPTRVALTSIKISDFLEKKWNWTSPVLISPPGVDDKNACIFPEKLKNKYLIFHRRYSFICLDLVDSLDFDGSKFIGISKSIGYRPGDYWDSRKIGIAAPPIKTKDGWLLIYHGVSDQDRKYRLGAMLLNYDNPSIVTSRPYRFILEPEEKYEREGQVPNVVFSCGAVAIEDTLFVYYGGGDKVIGVATANLTELLAEITETTKKFHIGPSEGKVSRDLLISIRAKSCDIEVSEI